VDNNILSILNASLEFMKKKKFRNLRGRLAIPSTLVYFDVFEKSSYSSLGQAVVEKSCPSCPDIKANMGVTLMGADSFQHFVLDHNTNIHLA